MLFRERTILETIDHLSTTAPERVWARYAVTSDDFERGTLRIVTFSDLVRAIDVLAWHLHYAITPKPQGGVVLYVGPPDIRYFILACAACKCNLKPLFSSPRNNLEAHDSLIRQTECQICLRPREEPLNGTLESIVSNNNLRVVDIPHLNELLRPAVDPKPWKIDYCRDLAEPFVVLHTSGSTGLPKAVNVTHGLYATLDFHQHLVRGDQRLNVLEWADRELFVTLPPFHAAGLNFFGWSVFHGTTLVMGPADQPPSVDTIERALDLRLGDAGVVAPSILEELVRDSCMLSKISRWSSVSFGGGPLSRAAGDALWQETKVHNLLGSTETNTLPEFVPDSKDEWPYHNFHPSLGIEFRNRQDELYELVIVRHDRWRTQQAIFWTFPELDEYPMKDLYERHPEKHNLWAYRGRVDDIIVLSNGEKFSPAEAELIISEHPDVKSAMMLGNNHAQSALLVELFNPNIQEPYLAELQKSILRRVQQANAILPHHAQIHDSHIKILSHTQCFLRSPKGEVRRAPTVQSLASEISVLYATADASAAATGQDSDLDFTNKWTLTSCLTELLRENTYLGTRVDPDTNLFQCGFDSLKVTRMLRHLKTNTALQDLQPRLPITSKLIYQNPSPRGLATALLQLVDQRSSTNPHSRDSEKMARLLGSFSKQIDTLADTTARRHIVILTGSTGSLGSYVLDSLLRNVNVEQVVCLNRGASGASRQTASHDMRGLTTDFSKVLFLETDLAKDRLGLEEGFYWDLTSRTTHIIHNAWPVNFNLSLSSFEPHLTGCLHLLAMAAASPHLQDLAFLSSVGVASSWNKSHSTEVPEAKIEDLEMAGVMGYSQSKLLAELIFAYGLDTLRVPVSICRIGQIAGPVLSRQGMWSSREWFPSILLTCKRLGKIPADLGALDCIDWIPVDMLADALTEAVLSVSSATRADKTSYLHFVNPEKALWSDMSHTMSLKLVVGKKLEVVSFASWLDCLAATSETLTELDDLPAVKLLDFLQDVAHSPHGGASFSTKDTQRLSSTLDTLPPVSVEWIEKWVNQWKKC